jgi:hypothetical protein
MILNKSTNMKTILSMFVLLLLQFTVFGQEASLNGKVTDVTNTALENVKITIDSMIQYTDKDGFFSFSNLAQKEYFIQIEMHGYINEKIQIDNFKHYDATMLEKYFTDRYSKK